MRNESEIVCESEGEIVLCCVVYLYERANGSVSVCLCCNNSFMSKSE